jgi:hypothetical protein
MKLILLMLVGSTWLFQPSTHKETKPQAPRRQRSMTEAYTNRGFRQARSTINVGGYVIDQTFLYESWSQKHE